MKLHTLWKLWDDDAPELLFALDEYVVEGNYEAWQAGIDAACKRYGITEVDLREVVVNVPRVQIVAAFLPSQVYAQVERTGELVASPDPTEDAKSGD